LNDVHLLQCEKCFHPILILGKKKYAGRKMLYFGATPELSSSGLETVRRDNCLLASGTQERCLQMILMEGDHKGERSIQYVHDKIRDLLMGRIPLSDLIISKNLSKSFQHYEESGTKQPHVELAKKIDARKHITGEEGYYTGDRVKYVVTANLKGTDSSDRAEDPIYALENRMSIDYHYYIENQLMKPLLRVFTPLLAPQNKRRTMDGSIFIGPKEDMMKMNKGGKKVSINAKELTALKAYKVLFVGDHMMSTLKPSATEGGTGIMKFAKVKTSCLRCKCSSVNAYCTSCKPLSRLTTIELTNKKSDLEIEQWKAWSTCQSCVGKYHTDISCANKDCNNFYHRTKVLVDIEDLDKKLKRIE